MHFRTGYLEEGVLQTHPSKLWHHYVNTTVFYVDCLCLLPLDFLYLSLGYQSIVRLIRLVKVYRFFDFIDKTERHTNYPNVVRLLILFHYVVLIFHWNACLVYSLRAHLPFHFENGTEVWHESDRFHNYLYAYYVSCRALTLVESLPTPKNRDKVGFAFVIAELVFGLLLFASILGHISNIVSNISAARKEFQGDYHITLSNSHTVSTSCFSSTGSSENLYDFETSTVAHTSEGDPLVRLPLVIEKDFR